MRFGRRVLHSQWKMQFNWHCRKANAGQENITCSFAMNVPSTCAVSVSACIDDLEARSIQVIENRKSAIVRIPVLADTTAIPPKNARVLRPTFCDTRNGSPGRYSTGLTFTSVCRRSSTRNYRVIDWANRRPRFENGWRRHGRGSENDLQERRTCKRMRIWGRLRCEPRVS